ncbi:MAG: polyphosphate kinase 1 [Bacteroidales bacterium]|jgi:polyphosphate kinase|nr:polyphosphate kinase 1 [Bacteroidales bacterium]
MEIINREISWLQFNARVLQEAINKEIPVIERIKFLGIYSNNIDEFYRVRIASINRLIDFNKKNYPAKVKENENLYKFVIEEILNQQAKFSKIKDETLKELEQYNLFIINEKELSSEQEIFVKKQFNENIFPGLFIVLLKKRSNLSHLNDGSIYLATKLTKQSGKKDYALIEIPTNDFSRFIILPNSENNGKKYIIRIDDVIRACLKDVFKIFDYETNEAFTIKITKDAEIEMYGNVSKSYMDIVAESVKKRQSGETLRFIYDETMPEDLLEILKSCFKITDSNKITKGSRYHNSKDFMFFPNLLGEKFEYKKLIPIPHRDIIQGQTILSSIQKKDILLHYPYNSFDNIIFLLQEASIDPKVKSIQMTLYRLAENSKIINSLLNAARNGKFVTVFLELKARFDEERNIFWTNKLEESGVNLIKTIPGIKVHTKLLLIQAKNKDEIIYYSNISTGNFNENTAKSYSDISLLTANPEIGKDVAKVFYLMESAYRNINFDHLIVSPFFMRNKIIELIDFEIENSKKGKNAWIQLKINNLTDVAIIEKLIDAAKAGVKIKISSRATCNLIGDKSENIITIGILDKFLEHSRIFAFCNDNQPKYFIGSADLMIRNFDLRIEVLVPVYDKNIQQELQTIFDIQFADNQSARDWNSKEENSLNNSLNLIPKIRTQEETYKFLKEKIY